MFEKQITNNTWLKIFSFILLTSCSQTLEFFAGITSNSVGDWKVDFIELENRHYVQGGQTLKLAWDLIPESHLGQNLSIQQVKRDVQLQISQDKGLTWNDLLIAVASDHSYEWKAPEVDSAEVRFRIRLHPSKLTPATQEMIDAVEWSGEQRRVIVDSVAPVVKSFRFSKDYTYNAYADVDFVIEDQIPDQIKSFCIILSAKSRPQAEDPCWIPAYQFLKAPDFNILQLLKYTSTLAFSPGSYSYSLWAQDEAKNVSVESLRSEIVIHKPTPPQVSQVVASTDPNTVDTLVGPTHEILYIKWKARDDILLAAQPISVYLVELKEENNSSEEFFTRIASNLNNSYSASACGNNSAAHTGCFVWQKPAQGFPQGSFRFVVEAVNEAGFKSAASSEYMNAPKMKILAGNIDSGILGNSLDSLFFLTSNPKRAQPNTIAIKNDGTLFYRDLYRGLLKVGPSGQVESLMRPGSKISGDGDGGPVAQARLRDLRAIALDFDGNLLLLDFDRIRKIDTQNWTIDTLVGGGTQSADEGVKPKDLLISQNSAPILVPLPNGDIYFSSSSLNISAPFENSRIRIFKKSSSPIESIKLYTSPHGSHPKREGLVVPFLKTCLINNFGLFYQQVGAVVNIQHLYTSLSRSSAAHLYDDCMKNWHGILLADSAGKYADFFVHSLDSRYEYSVQGHDGKLYRVSRNRGVIQQVTYNPAASTAGAKLILETIVGTGTAGECADGTPALECDISPYDAFVSQDGKLYFLDAGLIRVVDENSKVRTLHGQRFSYGDNKIPTLARFNRVFDFEKYTKNNEDHFVTLDFGDARFREFNKSKITTLAGNGSNREAENTTDIPATQQGLRFEAGDNYAYKFAIDPLGQIYFNRGQDKIARLNRSTGIWKDVVGKDNFVSPAWDKVADGISGLNFPLRTLDTSFGYLPKIYGYGMGPNAANGLFAGKHTWSQPLSSYSPHLFFFDGDKQFKFTRIAGKGTINAAGGISASSWSGNNAPEDDSPLLGQGIPAMFSKFSFDQDHGQNRAFVAQYNSNRIFSLDFSNQKVYHMFRSNNLIYALTHRSPSEAEDKTTFFICSSNGKIYEVQEGDTLSSSIPEENEIKIPIPGFRCIGRKIHYSVERNALIFVFQQNGIFGIAERGL